MGTATTCGGNIIVVMTSRNASFLPLKRNFASAYATGIDDTSMNAVASTAYMIVLRIQVSSGALPKMSPKLLQFQDVGHNSEVSACRSPMNAVRVMKTSGPRNMIDRATAIACLAIQ